VPASSAGHRRRSRSWLHYFPGGLAEEYERVATTIEDLSELVPGGPAQLQLTPSQQRALTRLRIEGRRELTRSEYERAASVDRPPARHARALSARYSSCRSALAALRWSSRQDGQYAKYLM